jgi:hypothetical protein
MLQTPYAGKSPKAVKTCIAGFTLPPTLAAHEQTRQIQLYLWVPDLTSIRVIRHDCWLPATLVFLVQSEEFTNERVQEDYTNAIR